MNFVFLLILSFTIDSTICVSVNVSNKCSCNEITTKQECNIDCLWSETSAVCIDPPSQLIRIGYCADQKNNCNKIDGCGYYENICIPFSGCSSVIENTNFGCQQYSIKCITDGNKCVQKTQCSNYKTRFSCKNSYDSNYNWMNYCFWDKSVCRDPIICSELSLSLRSDQTCRKQNSQCTYKPGGGCQDSGELCQDQKLEQQCFTNKKGTKKCYWDGSSCHDYSCKYITSNCITNGCSININQKCIDRQDCKNYLNQTECTYDQSNQQCMWEYGICIIKQCENANIVRINNELCQEINSNCITKFGGGCKTNGECEVADNKTGCKYNIRNEPCYWNGFQCVLKQCQWAPVSYQQVNLCKSFLSNCVYNGQQCIDGGCYSLDTQEKCQANKQCSFRQLCDIKSCETAGKDIYHVTHQDCQSYLKECTLSDAGIGCVPLKYSCSQYERQFQCYLSIQGLCSWFNNQCQDSQCEYLNYSTHYQCNSRLSNCTTNGTTCVKIEQNCSTYQTEIACTYNKLNVPCTWLSSKCQEMTCQLIPKISQYNSYDSCNSYYNQCTVIERVTGCIVIPENCSDMNQDQCQTDQCIYSNGACREKQCSDYRGSVSQTICEAYIAGKKCMIGTGYPPTNCVDKVAECNQIFQEQQCQTNLSQGICSWQYGLCVDNNKICTYVSAQSPASCNQDKKCGDSNISDVEKTDEICENYLISCHKNPTDKQSCTDKNQPDKLKCNYYVSQKYCTSQLSNCYWSQSQTCEQIKTDCSDYPQADCASNVDELGRYCSVSGENCVLKCTILEPKNNSCSLLDQQCAINGSVCINKLNDCSYNDETSCEDDENCRWDNTNTKCLIRDCSDITDQKNHNFCNSYKSTCTSAYQGGCQSLLTNCSDYKNKTQCKLSLNNKQCFWRSDDACYEKICQNVIYSNTKLTSQCDNYFDDLKCVANDKNDGCMELKDQCSQYTINYQCNLQSDGTNCQWINEKCQQSQCQYVILATYTHENCYNSLSKIKCTINDNQDGCTILQDKCELYLNKFQCYISKTNEQCLWNDFTFQCQLKTCFDQIPTNTLCNDYLSTCIQPIYNCRDIICEDYIYQTDEECNFVNSKCTTNGSFCVRRGTCEQNKTEKSCNIDINNKLCGWNTSKQQCSYLTCNDAPNTLKYDQNCDFYFPNINCVAKNGGGCTQINTCFDYTIENTCNQSRLFQCIWDGISCRYQKCSDHFGTNVYDCQNKLINCTSDGVKCIDMLNCSQLPQSQCTLGSDGPCIYLNNSCVNYKSCESIQMTSHNDCFTKLQSQCTSDGTKCISLTTCNEYKTQTSCVIDVKQTKCAWNNFICEPFISCEQYKFKTHNECYSINSSCTTNTVDSCQSFQSCSQYKFQENCKFNDVGIIIQNNKITSTGACSWNDNSCVNSICINLIGITHSICNNQLSSCTSNGLKCINMEDTCVGYSTSECNSAESTQGQCQIKDFQCQLLDCTKITNEQQCLQIKHCQFAQNLCRLYNKCQDYQSQDLCTLGVDGQCQYKNNKCQLITLCQDISQQQQCNSKYCNWDDTNKKCIDHNCLTYGKLNTCGSFYNYNNTILTYCGYGTGNECLEQNPNDWSSNVCYLKSLGYFQLKDNYCSSCKIIINNNTNITNNTQNNTNGTVANDDLSFKIEVIAIILLLMI